MKVAILSESSADDAAIKILIEGILGKEIELVLAHQQYQLKTRGWPNVRKLLPSFFKYWYYQTEAEAVIVIVDSDDDPIHRSEHEAEGKRDGKCRLCLLQQDINNVHSGITLPVGREQIKTAVGVAVPAIEAWFRCIEDSRVTEATWGRKMNGEKVGYDRKSLKKDVYGSERPTRQMVEEGSMKAVKSLVDNLDHIQQCFPQGFDCLVSGLKNW